MVCGGKGEQTSLFKPNVSRAEHDRKQASAIVLHEPQTWQLVHMTLSVSHYMYDCLCGISSLQSKVCHGLCKCM